MLERHFSVIRGDDDDRVVQVAAGLGCVQQLAQQLAGAGAGINHAAAGVEDRGLGLGQHGDGQLDIVRAALGEPERIGAALGYYRAMFDPALHDPALQSAQDALGLPTPIPTLYLHGRDDGCFGVDSIGDPLASLPEGSAVQIIDDAGHFLQLEQPEAVAAAVLGFLTD